MASSGSRKRDYKAEYARRQERARALGYRGYYQRRVAGTEAGTEARARARGHRSYRALLAGLREGDLVGLDPVGSVRDAQGRWTRVVVSVLGEDGEEREYVLTGGQLTDARIRELVDAVDAAGAINSPLYPLAKLAGETEAMAA